MHVEPYSALAEDGLEVVPLGLRLDASVLVFIKCAGGTAEAHRRDEGGPKRYEDRPSDRMYLSTP